MSKKAKRVGFISEEDMRTWTEYLATGRVHGRRWVEGDIPMQERFQVTLSSMIAFH